MLTYEPHAFYDKYTLARPEIGWAERYCHVTDRPGSKPQDAYHDTAK